MQGEGVVRNGASHPHPCPEEVTSVEALERAGGGILESSSAELGAGGAGGIVLEPSPAELGAGGAGGILLEPSLAELGAEKDCIRITSPLVEVGCEVTTEL